MCLANLSIDYIEGKQNTYKKLELTINDETFIFNSGDPIVDWWDYIGFLIDLPDDITVIHSSIVDHWFIDGDDYYEMYINSATKKEYKYKELEKMSFDEINKCLKLIANKSMTGFDDVKNYVKNYKAEKKKINGK